jgi:hypothetical protein
MQSRLKNYETIVPGPGTYNLDSAQSNVIEIII